MSSRFLSKNFKIKIDKTIIMPVLLDVYETWSYIIEGMQAKVGREYKNKNI